MARQKQLLRSKSGLRGLQREINFSGVASLRLAQGILPAGPDAYTRLERFAPVEWLKPRNRCTQRIAFGARTVV